MPLEPEPESSNSLSISDLEDIDLNSPLYSPSNSEIGVALPGNALAGLPASVSSVATEQLTQFVVPPVGLTFLMEPADSASATPSAPAVPIPSVARLAALASAATEAPPHSHVAETTATSPAPNSRSPHERR